MGAPPLSPAFGDRVGDYGLRDRDLLVDFARFPHEPFDGHQLLGARSRAVSGARAYRELHRTHCAAEVAGNQLLATRSAGYNRVGAGETQAHLDTLDGRVALCKADGCDDPVDNKQHESFHVSPPFNLNRASNFCRTTESFSQTR